MQDDFDDSGMGLPDDEIGGGPDSGEELDAADDVDLDLGEGGEAIGRMSGGTRSRSAAPARKAPAPRAPAKKATAAKAPAPKAAKSSGRARKAAARKGAAKKSGSRKAAAKKKGGASAR